MRCLITGGAGTIGFALAQQILLQTDWTVGLCDNNEDGLFNVSQIINGSGFQDRVRLMFCDVRDRDRLAMVCSDVDYLFHCAALKHVELSEKNPSDYAETNIVGTQNVIRAALDANVKKTVFTSSDKAVNPTNIMGSTKLVGEKLVVGANNLSGKKDQTFSVVRFGNVLDSAGSVYRIFANCIREGVPLPITSQEMTRFFITKKMAIDLCMYALKDSVGGEIYTLRMKAARVTDLGRAMSDNPDISFVEVGLKPGEKTYEELFSGVELGRLFLSDNVYRVYPELSTLVRERHVDAVRNKMATTENITGLFKGSSTVDLINWRDLRQFLLDGGVL